jgi:hypothetical protein
VKKERKEIAHDTQESQRVDFVKDEKCLLIILLNVLFAQLQHTKACCPIPDREKASNEKKII